MFWIFGLYFTKHIGVGAFITSLCVILVPIVTLFFGDRPSRNVWFALPVSIAGLAALSLDSAVGFGSAEFAFLIAALFFALYFVLNSRAATRVPLMPLTFIQLLCVGVGALIISALMLEPWYLSPPTEIWLWLLASVLIATSLRFFLQTWAQGKAPASNAALIMTLEPVWVATLATFWFAERMSLMQLTGCALIFVALVVSRLRNPRKLLSSIVIK